LAFFNFEDTDLTSPVAVVKDSRGYEAGVFILTNTIEHAVQTNINSYNLY
jgi:hypothetical protein